MLVESYGGESLVLLSFFLHSRIVQGWKLHPPPRCWREDSPRMRAHQYPTSKCRRDFPSLAQIKPDPMYIPSWLPLPSHRHPTPATLRLGSPLLMLTLKLADTLLLPLLLPFPLELEFQFARLLRLTAGEAAAGEEKVLQGRAGDGEALRRECARGSSQLAVGGRSGETRMDLAE